MDLLGCGAYLMGSDPGLLRADEELGASWNVTDGLVEAEGEY